MEKIRIGIHGYGNLGRGVECAAKQNPDIELAAIYTRRDPSAVKPLTPGIKVLPASALDEKQDIDVLIICSGSAFDLPKQTPRYASLYNVIDSFDNHHDIPKHFKNVDAAAKAAGKIPVDVRQGYARCSSAVVDGRSVITADPGIAAALMKLGDVDVLTVEPGHVLLPGFDYGFIGGASGRVGDELIFSGDLSAHPDFRAIEAFADQRGVRLKCFPEFPLTDIGSIIEISG